MPRQFVELFKQSKNFSYSSSELTLPPQAQGQAAAPSQSPAQTQGTESPAQQTPQHSSESVSGVGGRDAGYGALISQGLDLGVDAMTTDNTFGGNVVNRFTEDSESGKDFRSAIGNIAVVPALNQWYENKAKGDAGRVGLDTFIDEVKQSPELKPEPRQMLESATSAYNIGFSSDPQKVKDSIKQLMGNQTSPEGFMNRVGEIAEMYGPEHKKYFDMFQNITNKYRSGNTAGAIWESAKGLGSLALDKATDSIGNTAKATAQSIGSNNSYMAM